MNTETLHNIVLKAQEALRTFLLTIIDAPAPLTAEIPQQVAAQQTAADLSAALVIHDKPGRFAVALDAGWVPLLSKAMLGEAMQAGDPGAEDLIREVGAQAYGAVRTALAGEGVQLSETALAVSLPGTGAPTPQDPLWRTTFQMEVKSTGHVLKGFALFPPVPEASRSSTNPTAAASRRSAPVEVAPASFTELGAENLGGDGGQPENFDLLAEIELEVAVELGRRRLPLADVLRLTPGSVIELEKLVGEPLEIYANGRLIAEGEAVVIDEQFGIRITNLASKRQREKAFF